jgi:hypothetical protein
MKTTRNGQTPADAMLQYVSEAQHQHYAATEQLSHIDGGIPMTDTIRIPRLELQSLADLAYTAEQSGCESLMALLNPLVDSLSDLQHRLSKLLPAAEEAQE